MLGNNILIIGGSGYFGRELNNYLGKNNVLLTYFNNKIEDGIFFDLQKSSLVEIKNSFPHLKKVIIAAGINNFKLINENPEEAYYYNVECTKNLIDEIYELEILPIFLSSESVFDGRKGNYNEFDLTNPRFPYAEHKNEIEKYIINKFKDYLILRIAKIYDSNFYGNTLVANWIRMLNNNENIYCADDNIFSPIHLIDLCEITKILMERDLTGIFHLSGPSGLNRKKMLDIVIGCFKKFSVYKGEIIYKSLNDFQGAENQPLNTSLNPNKVVLSTGIKLKSFEFWVNEIMKDYNKNNETRIG